ncbi:MAG: NUDIX domain-containing protein [Minisyncoccia bacterium]
MNEEKIPFEENVSYSAGVAFVFTGDKKPQLLLVLQKAGEKNPQKAGGIFTEDRVWKMPMGHFNREKDSDLISAARREFEEETGFTFDGKLIDSALSVAIRIPSERPGAEFHEDRFFLVVSEDEPKPAFGTERDAAIEKARFFPLNKLPDGNTSDSDGAALSWGHRKKLMKLLVACEENPKGKEIVEYLIGSFKGK